MSFDYIKKESKKLVSMSLLAVGFLLVIEHVYTYGYISLGDFLGHEWLGIIFIIIGLFWANKKWSGKESRIQYAISKFKALKGGLKR